MIKINNEVDKYIEDIKRLSDIEEKNTKIIPVSMDKVDVGHTDKGMDNSNKEEDNSFGSILQEEIKKYL